MKTYNDYKNMINQELATIFEKWPGTVPDVLRTSMAYSLSAGGKRLRPVLLLAACDAVKGSISEAMPFACALEMIHTYSLIHDDLPAMDNDDLRRGKATNHKVFGEAVAILAGDGLLSAAVEIMCRASLEMNDTRGLKAAERIAARCGIAGMIAGQVMDVTQEGTEPTDDKVSYIQQHKTADLLTAPMEAGMIIGGAPERLLENARQYGYHLGMAFQMIDDLLDVTGDAAVLGKNTGTDPLLGKLTRIACVGVNQTREEAKNHVDAAAKAAEMFDDEDRFFRRLAYESLDRVL